MGAIYEEPTQPLESVISLSDNQAYGQVRTRNSVIPLLYNVPTHATLVGNYFFDPHTGGFHGFHGTPLLRESLPVRTEIIVRMRASYSRAHSRVCVLHATNRDVQTTAPLTASAVCS